MNLTKKTIVLVNFLLKKYQNLFDGTLGNFNEGKINIELKPGATPFRGQSYPILQAQKDLMRM